MKKVKIVLWTGILLLVQVCLIRYIAVKHIAPELLFVFAVCYALHEKNEKLRFVVPVACGAAVDLMSGQVFGLNMLIYTLAGAGGVWVANVFYRTGTVFQFPLIFVLSAAAGSLYFVLNAGTFARMGYGSMLWEVIFPTACYNTAAALIILPLVRKTWKQRR